MKWSDHDKTRQSNMFYIVLSMRCPYMAPYKLTNWYMGTVGRKHWPKCDMYWHTTVSELDTHILWNDMAVGQWSRIGSVHLPYIFWWLMTHKCICCISPWIEKIDKFHKKNLWRVQRRMGVVFFSPDFSGTNKLSFNCVVCCDAILGIYIYIFGSRA